MEKIHVTQVGGRQRNVTFRVTAMLGEELPMTPIDLGDKALKLTSLLWAVQEKLGLYLWWNGNTIILPMESRNAMRFDQALTPPADWNGVVYLSSFGWAAPKRAFLFVMDFDR